MKYLPFAFLMLLSSMLLAQDMVILHTSDIHSHLNGLAPESEYTPQENDQDPTMGGFSRIAGYIQSQKELYGDKLLVVDAGDFTMGTLFQVLETNGGFELNLMKQIGYDYVAIGNHEFDFGANVLADIISGSKSKGEIPQLICSNYLPSKAKNDDKLLNLFDTQTILPYAITERNGIKIGLIALIGKSAEGSIPGNFEVRVENIKSAARRTARKLKNELQADFVIALSHTGLEKNKKGEWQGEDYGLAGAVPEIDLITSAHTHINIDHPVYTKNGVVVHSGYYGKYVGKISVTCKEVKKPEIIFQKIAMDDNILADASVQKIIDDKALSIENELLKPIGASFYKPVFETNFEVKHVEKEPEQSNVGPLVSDATHYYLNELYNQNIDVTIVANGVVRHPILPGKNGEQNINDLFNIMPLGQGEGEMPGSPMGKIYITGNELKKVMELIVAVYHSDFDYYLFFSGMQITYNPQKGLFKKISEIKIGNEQTGYKQVSFSKKDKTLYCIAANKYILGFIGKLKKMSFGIVNVVGKYADGSIISNDDFLIDTDLNTEGIQEAKEWLALYYYLKSFKDTNGNDIPDLPDMYKDKVNSMVVSTR